MHAKASPALSQATEIQVVELGKILTPFGEGLYVRPDPEKERLADGVYIQQSGGKWVMSLYRNVMTEGNDVEVAIDVDALVTSNIGAQDSAAAWAWLTAQSAELQHAVSGKHWTPPRESKAREPFRIGLKLAQAHIFVNRLRHERAKRRGRWSLSANGRLQTDAGGYDSTPGIAVIHSSVITRMIENAHAACGQSGKAQTSIAKNKEFRFTNDEARELLTLLLASGRCAITNIALDLTGKDSDLAPSLDRRDSNGHYEAGNVQIVAWFVNRWKSDDRQENFERLLGLLRKQRSDEPPTS